MSHRLRHFGIVVAITFAVAGSVQADPPPMSTTQPSSTPQSDPNNPTLWNADRMMEDAVQTLIRRYNLNDEQGAYTRELLVSKTKLFLKEYESELRQLLKESIEMRINPRKATPENYKRWAERARPLFDRARKDILEGNAEWHEILNDAQKQIHRFDLDLMQQNFGQIDGLITKWSGGNFNPSDIAPQPPPEVAQGDGRTESRITANPPTQSRTIEDIWQIYVTTFMDTYKFTQDQRNSGYAILQDSRARAKGHRDSRKKDLEQIEARLREEAARPGSSAKVIELRAQQAQLEQPISDIFRDLQRRLEQLPVKAQREAVTPEQLSRLETLARLCLPAQPVELPTTVGPSDGAAKPTNRRAATSPPTTRASTAPAATPVSDDE